MPRGYVISSLIAVSLCLSVRAFGSQAWLPAQPGNAPDMISVSVVSGTIDEVILEVEVPGFYASEVPTDHGLFSRLEIPGCGQTSEIGKALLPILRRAVEIPLGSTAEIEVLERATVEYTLKELAVPERVFPVQEPIEKLPGAREAARFSISEDFYASRAHYPAAVVRIAETGQMRAHRFAVLEFAPVSYEPASGVIQLTHHLVVRVSNPGADLGRTLAAIDRYASPAFENAAASMLLNYRAPSTRAVPAWPLGYLIITDPDFYAAIEPLAEWKNSKGYQTTVTQTNDIPGGATTTAIQAYIRDAWQNWEIPPTFVLLVGDVGDIPNWTGTAPGNPPTDLYYSTMTDADFIPDVGLGRFSVVTSAQASNLVEKTLDYEKVLFTSGTAWLKKAVFMASEDNYSITEGTHNYVISDYLDAAGFTSDKLYCHTYNATTQQVRDAFNDGRVLGIYSGHGASTSWADGPPFSQSDVNNLTNLDMYPLIQSYACYTGQYTTSECFAETWTRAIDKAAIAFWGSSVTSYWDEDDVLEKGVFRAQFEDSLTWISGMLNQGKWYLYEHYSGGGSTQRYYEMYNLFGDPSLDIWTDAPATMAASHAGTCPVGASSYSMHVEDGRGGLPDALVCLDMPDEVYETAYTDANGDADLTLDPAPAQVGQMTLTITCHNFAPAIDSVEVIVPALVTIDPDTILVETPTAVTVTVQDTLYQPMTNVVVTIDGWGIDPPLVDTTDASGQAMITVDAPYGETLSIVGRQIGEAYDCVAELLFVAGALPLPNPGLEARVDEVGLIGALTPYYAGMIKGQVAHAGLDMFAVGCGVDTSVSSSADTALLEVVPTRLGVVTTALSYPGYEIYLEDVPVIEVYGMLSGTVHDASTTDSLVGVPVSVYAAGADTSTATPVFETTSGAAGAYTAPDSIPAGPYDLYATHFGYLDYFGSTMVYWGGNTYDIGMTLAPSGQVSGTVTEVGTGRPITATIWIYRSDDMSLYSQTTSDSLAGGSYGTDPLPYFAYLFQVKAVHFMTEDVYVTVDEATETVNFGLVPTEGNLLVIDDDTGDKDTGPKLGHKGRILFFDGDAAGDRGGVKSATLIAQDLQDLGYDVTSETSASTNPATWFDYDIVIWSSGGDADPVSDVAYRSDLNAYVAGHGKLMIEGGEVGYDAASYPGYPNFADTTLHVIDWQGDSSGDLSLALPAHPIATTPNTLPATLPMTYIAYGDQDALVPDAMTQVVYEWSSYSGLGGVLVYDDNPDPVSAQVVFYGFDYANVTDTDGRAQLLENTVSHLLAQEPTPEGAISGQVTLYGEPSHEGVLVRTFPVGPVDTTGATGNYEITGLYNGTYQATASKTGFGDSTVTVEIIDGGTVEDVDFTLYPTIEYMDCPELVIPDNDPAVGIHALIDVQEDVEISAVDCYVNIEHSFRGDLIVQLRSPEGTVVHLHNQTGGSADDIDTWYDLQTDPDGPGTMDDFIGECAKGEWELWVTDNASLDVGTLHCWGLRIETPEFTAAEEEGLTGAPSAYFLAQNYPNPFNPLTHVQFGVPKAGEIELSIYNVQGQRVAVLASGEYPPGVHTLAWDGADDKGYPVASGIYFCRLTTVEFTATHRMVLIR